MTNENAPAEAEARELNRRLVAEGDDAPGSTLAITHNVDVAVNADISLYHLHDETPVPMAEIEDSKQDVDKDVGQGRSQKTWLAAYQCPQCGTRTVGQVVITTNQTSTPGTVTLG
jgi:hypothetical protein